MLFHKYIELRVGNKKITSDDLDIEFEIPFARSKEQDVGEVVIYNLSDSTINDIREHNNIRIMAGYKEAGNIANIFSGHVKQVIPSWVGMDREVTLLLADGSLAWARGTLRRTYPTGSTDALIMRDLINTMGNKPALVEPNNNRTHSKPFKINGPTKDELARLVSETDSTIVNEKGYVYINSGEPIGETGFVLNKETGLIGTPEEITEVDEKGNKKTPTWELEMLLNPLITKGVKLKVESNQLNGEFIVQTGVHTKEFNTKCEVVRWSGG